MDIVHDPAEMHESRSASTRSHGRGSCTDNLLHVPRSEPPRKGLNHREKAS